jgi:hypothetical protein
MALGYLDKPKQKRDRAKKKEQIIFDLLNIYKIDIVFASFCILLISGYNYYVSLQQVPSHDAAFYLLNARDWLTDKPLDEHYRPPLISWIIAGIWAITGEDWVIVKWLQPIFTIGSGVVLYLLLRKYKGGLFAFGVTSLTMTQASIFLATGYIQPEGMALLFLVLTIYLLKLRKEKYWFLAGITIALTFASRYPVFIQAVAIFLVEIIIVRNAKLAYRAILGGVPILIAVVSVVYLKAGIFQIALGKDTTVTTSLSPFYLVNSIEIWGLAFFLAPIALLQKRTYTDSFNYVFIAWFLISLLFWSSSSENHQFRFSFQFTPAVYYLSLLAIENILKSDISLKSLRSLLRGIRPHPKVITKSLGRVILLCSYIASSILLVLLIVSFFTGQSYFEKQLLPIQQEQEQEQEQEQQPQQIQDNRNISDRLITYSVKILSPSPGQSFLINSQNSLAVIGSSTLPSTLSNIYNNNTLGGCQVSVIVNNVRPYQKAIPTGPNGINDYSSWRFEINSDYTQIMEGLNRITAKLSCPSISNDTESQEDIKSYSVFITGLSDKLPNMINNSS